MKTDMIFATNHLTEWISHHVPEKALADAMFEQFLEEPDYWSETGWPALRTYVEDRQLTELFNSNKRRLVFVP